MREKVYRDFVVRRLKRHVKVTHPKTNLPVDFPERQVQPIPVVMDVGKHPDFLAAQRELLAFVAPELRRAMRSRRYDDALAYLDLLKRSVSTAYALHSTVRKIRDRLQVLASEAVAQGDPPFEAVDGLVHLPQLLVGGALVDQRKGQEMVYGVLPFSRCHPFRRREPWAVVTCRSRTALQATERTVHQWQSLHRPSLPQCWQGD